MSNYITIGRNFKVSDKYNSDDFNNPLLTIDGLLAQSSIGVNIPNGTSSAAEYRQVLTGNFNLIKTDSATTGAIPFIYVILHGDEVNGYYDVNVLEGVNEYGTKAKADSTAERYYYYTGSTVQVDVSIMPGLSNYIASNIDYNDSSYQWFSGVHGVPFTIDTNLPVFLVSDSFNTNNPLVLLFMKHMITPEYLVENYSEVIDIVNVAEEKKEKVWYIYNEYRNGSTDLLDGFVPTPNSLTIRKYEKIKAIGGELSMVKQSDGTYSIVNNGATIIGSYYGTQDTYTYDKYLNEIHVTSGFVGYWDKRTVSASINCATRFDTNMYYYRSQEDYDDVISGRKTPEEVAENYPEVNGGGKKENNTGTRDKKTEMGTPSITLSGTGVGQVILSKAQLTVLSYKMFTNDDSQWDLIEKGLRMYGGNPIDSVIDLAFYPFNVTNICNVGPLDDIKLGGWNTGVSGRFISSSNKTLKMGSMYIDKTFKNFKDFYTQTAQIWLPYIGLKQLDIKRFMGKTLSVEYAVDLFTHSCTAYLFADDIMVDYYNGTMGVTLPLTATNFSAYATKMIELTASMGAGVIGAAVGGGVGAVGLAGALPQVASITNINNYRETKGSVTSFIGAFSPQYVYLLFEQLESVDDEESIRNLRGLPSNSSGSISSFSGFLSVSNVNLVCGGATETEKQEILSYLNNGIYI